MCTLMQKDASIEVMADIIASIARHQESQPNDPQSAQDWRNAVEWRETLYDNLPEQINYQDVKSFVVEMNKKYH
jgi:hypothetical protein